MFAGEMAGIVAYALISIVDNRATMVKRIGEKEKEKYTDFMWFDSVPIFTGTTT